VTQALLLVASYLLGAVPTSYIVGRVSRGIDLREHGSGNLGATNTFRVLGWRLALPVLIFDVFKGWLPTYLFPTLDAAAPVWAYAYGIAAIVGHVYSVFVGFRGGKGVATSTGVFLALAPAAVGVGLAIWLAIVFTTRIVSLASIVAALTLPLTVYALRGTTDVFWVSVGLAAFVIYAHRSNIKRLLKGEEHRFGRSGAKEGR